MSTVTIVQTKWLSPRVISMLMHIYHIYGERLGTPRVGRRTVKYISYLNMYLSI